MSEAMEAFRRSAANYYADRLREFGPGPRGMDWRDGDSQRRRFLALVRNLELSGDTSILDVGCGDGELLVFLREQGYTGTYRGIDVCAEMVAACQARFGPQFAEQGSTSDLSARGWQADYVVASGTFNVKQEAPADAWNDYLIASLCEMYRASRVATAFNVMSSRAEQQYERLFYLDPAAVPAIAASCGVRGFVLDHSYPLFEQTVTLIR